jgi:hypothetical protein
LITEVFREPEQFIMAQDISIFEDNTLSIVPALSTYPYPFSSAQYLIALYDTAIRACELRDLPKAQSSILDLMATLKMPHSRSSSRLFILFKLCLDYLQARDYREAREILRIVREAWLTCAHTDHGPAARA